MVADIFPDTALLQLFQLRGFKAPRKQDMDSLLEYLRGITGVDFLRYPERDMWPNWNSEEYRERISEEYITTDPRASKRDYFSVLLEGTLVEIYADIRYRLQRNRGVATVVSLGKRLAQSIWWFIRGELTMSLRHMCPRPVIWRPSVPPLQSRCRPCFLASQCLCYTT